VVFLRKKHIQQKDSFSLPQRIETVIRDHFLFHRDDKVIVGVSGGADSVSLLHLLHRLELNLELIAVYIDHGLRPEEIKVEKQTIKEYCRDLHIPFISKSVNVRGYAVDTKCSIEEAARILRHEALELIRTDQQASSIALAHTADDQVEEFFIRLMRGTSLKGLSGMLLKRDYIIRPLLQESKATLMNYLSKKKLQFCQDSSNFNRKFLRNRVRLDLLPKLEKEFNPSIRKTLLQNMNILGHDEDFLDEVSREAFDKCVSSDQVTDRDKASVRVVLMPAPFTDFHHAIQCRIIEKCFWLMRIKPGYLQIRSFLQFTQTAENNDEIHLADGVRVIKSRNQIVLSRPLQRGQLRGSAPVSTLSPRQIPEIGSYPIKELGMILKLSSSPNTADIDPDKETLFLDIEKITFPLLLRSPNPGERFRPYNAPGKKKILRYLGEKKIDIKRRSGYPVLVCGTRVIALPGLEISHEVRVTQATKNILAIELIEEDTC
jgi:tRNA(Ile)-lysidine synthase